jgi:hypothetical protein
MKKVTADISPVMALGPSQARDMLDWMYRGGWNAEVLHYPRTVISRALADDEPIMYVPVGPILRFETLAAKPGTSVLQIAQGLQKISALVDKIGGEFGFREAEMMTCVEDEMKLCVKRGWYVVLYDAERKTWLLRHRLPTTEPLNRGNQ